MTPERLEEIRRHCATSADARRWDISDRMAPELLAYVDELHGHVSNLTERVVSVSYDIGQAAGKVMRLAQSLAPQCFEPEGSE